MKMLRTENLVPVVFALVVGLCFFFLDPDQTRTGNIFIGLIGMSLYALCFRFFWRVAPSSSRVFLALHTILLAALLLIPARGVQAAGLLLPFPLFVAAAFSALRENARALDSWLATAGFSHVAEPPVLIWETLGTANQWRCFAHTFALRDGRTIPFHYWQGTVPVVSSQGGHQITMRDPVVAFSFPQTDVGERFMAALETMDQRKLSFFQKLQPSTNRKHPYTTERLADGSFVVGWSQPHTIRVVRGRLQLLRELLEDTGAPA